MGKKVTIDRAMATMREQTVTDAQKTAVTRTLSGAMAQSPHWGAASRVQAAVAGWVRMVDELEANAQVIAGLLAQIEAAEAVQETLRRDWAATKRELLCTVTVFCSGSADVVRSFNLDVVTYRKRVLLDAPEGLVVDPGKRLGEVKASWQRGLARNGFFVQHATDPNDPTTISPPVPWTKISFKLGGLEPGAHVSFRVAAVDPKSPTGTSPWSAWVIGNAR
jgi:hypothetical protein